MVNKEKNFASAVIYVHNAQSRLEEFLKMIITTMEANFEHSEIICVNDFSEDNSLELIKKASESAVSTTVSVVNMSHFHGLELAMNAGIDLAIGDFVFEFDNTYCDFDASVIMQIYRHALEGYDIVSASADRKEKLTSRIFYHFFARYTQLSYRMSTESFRVLSRRALNRIASMNNMIPYRKAVYTNCGLKMDNIRYKVVKSVLPSTDRKEKDFRVRLAVDSMLLFTEVGYRFAGFMTAFMMAMSAFMIVFSIVVYATANPVEGWTTTILFLSVAFLGLFGILTIIIKYLNLLVDLVFKKKHYNFQSIEKLTK